MLKPYCNCRIGEESCDHCETVGGVDANWWREECNYISRVTTHGGKVPEMNFDIAAFRKYCKMQRDIASGTGFTDVATYIQECIDDL